MTVWFREGRVSTTRLRTHHSPFFSLLIPVATVDMLALTQARYRHDWHNLRVASVIWHRPPCLQGRYGPSGFVSANGTADLQYPQSQSTGQESSLPLPDNGQCVFKLWRDRL